MYGGDIDKVAPFAIKSDSEEHDKHGLGFFHSSTSEVPRIKNISKIVSTRIM